MCFSFVFRSSMPSLASRYELAEGLPSVWDKAPLSVTDTVKVGTNLLGRLQRFLQIADAASHRDLFAVVKNNDVFAFHHWLKLLDTVDVHYGRTAHAHKLFGRKLFFQRAHRLAQQVRLVAHMQQSIICSRLDPVNVPGFDNDNPIGGLDDEARGVRLRRLQAFEQREDAVVRVSRSPFLDMLARLLQSGFETCRLERLQQIIQGVDLKGLQGMLV